jgi:putative endonuclease
MDRRLYEHNIGHSKFTRTGIPWEIAHCEEFSNEIEAKKKETYIKRMKSRIYIENLISKGRASRS